MSMCELTIVQGHDQNLGQMLIIHDDQRRTIGRSSACDFKVDDEMMSGMHCQVLLNKNWLIRDLLSRNGLLVNETAVHEKQLKPGDRIQIGQTMFEFQLAGATGSGQPGRGGT